MRRYIYLTIIAAFLCLLIFKSFKPDKSKMQGIPAAISKKSSIEKRKIIADTILLVAMSFDETFLIDPIRNKISSFYQIPVKFIVSQLPAHAFFKQRNRYRADSLLNYLHILNNGRYRFVAGITSRDISCTNGPYPDWGIFGLGSLSGKGCVTSSFRLKRNASRALLTERIQKVILHEIGHNCKLDHCTSPYPCFMKAADGKISQVDSEPMDMCKLCRQKAKIGK